MKHTITCYIGILGVSLFVVAAILGGFLIENYSIVSQYISETYAIDTTYGINLRTLGYIPSGILVATFCFLASSSLHPSKRIKTGFYGIGIFYGLATVVVAIFPCDSGCNPEFINPTYSQVIHNFVGLLTYLFVPIFMILIGLGLKKSPIYNRFSLQSIVLGVTSMFFVFVLLADAKSAYIGLFQRIIESVFVIWIIICAILIKNIKPITIDL